MNPAGSSSDSRGTWPELPFTRWQDTCSTLHLWTQIVGKTRLALSPMQNHWWQVVLYVTARGLSTSPMPCGGDRLLEVEFDFIDQVLIARTSDGGVRTLPLGPRTVADFYREYVELLESLDVEFKMRPVPSEIPNPIPFTKDTIHRTYEADHAKSFWSTLVQIDRVFQGFRSRFLGKQSPVHLWWGSFDLACTRFSGRRAPTHPGGIPNLPDRVTREAYSHECFSAGWWPGNGGGPIQEPSFYAYAYPEPPGFPLASVRPATASYNTTMREWVLPYDAVLRAPDRDALVLDFLESTYETAANLGSWDRKALERQREVSTPQPSS